MKPTEQQAPTRATGNGFAVASDLTLCDKMTPEEANARFVLGMLLSETIVEVANEWIDGGIYTDSLGELCTIKAPIMSEVGPVFASAMTELGLSPLDRREAAMMLAQIALQKISDGCPEPLREAESLYSNVYKRISAEIPDKKFVGDCLGLQRFFCWLRKIWDCRDGSRILYHTDLPRKEAEV